jgi:hypothetical protein
VLAELDVLAEKAEKVCVALLNGLEGNGPLATEIKSVLAGAGVELEGAVGQVAGDVSSLLKPYKAGLDMPSHPEEVDKLRRKIREAMADRFFSTGISASVQKILKQRLYDVEQQMRQVMDGVFEQADTAARELIATVLGGVDEKLTEFMGGAAKVMAGAELKGKAHIRGDSLTDLRLDLKVEFKAAEAMKAHVFLEIRELNSENTPGGCLPKGETGTEVTLGAKEVSLEWAYPGLTVSFDTRFQFAGDGGLTGLGGSIEILGDIKFGDQFIISEIGSRKGTAQLFMTRAADAASLEAIEHGLAQCRDHHRFGTKATIANDIMALQVAHVEQRQAIDVDAKVLQQRRQRQCVQAAGLDRGDRRLVIKLPETFAGRELRPVRRAQAGDAAAFLIDQDRHIAAGQIAQ